MVGIKVKHSVFGVGTVTAQDDKYLTIEFANKTSRFIYPDVFEKFIRAEDPAVQDEIIRNINDAKVRAEQKRKADEAARKAAEEHKATEEAARRAEISRKTSYSPKAAARTQRIDGKRRRSLFSRATHLKRSTRVVISGLPFQTKQDLLLTTGRDCLTLEKATLFYMVAMDMFRQSVLHVTHAMSVHSQQNSRLRICGNATVVDWIATTYA